MTRLTDPEEEFSALEDGRRGSHGYRVTACLRGRGPRSCRPVSYMHDVPLALHAPSCTANFVCEIGKGTSAKMEVNAANAPLTPIRQDVTRGGRLRRYAWTIPWNYGMLPQTWEDPAHRWAGLERYAGDGDPVDVIEVGAAQCSTGSVHRVKLLGALAMIDGGELDWKLLAVRCDDPDAQRMSTVEDMKRLRPGELSRIKAWFRGYKVPDGKAPNAFALRGKALGAQEAAAVASEGHRLWRRARMAVDVRPSI